MLQTPTPALKERFLCLLTALVRKAYMGELPTDVAPYMMAGTLLPFSKPAGGIRPIAVGETLRRLISKVFVILLKPKMLDLFTPTQVGVAIPAAPEQVCHTLRQLCHQLPRDQQYVLQVHLKIQHRTKNRYYASCAIPLS